MQRSQPAGRSRLRWFQRQLAFSEEGAQIIELAVSLPLLALLFVGTYDVGQAFSTKQKLVAATREAVRFAANESTMDLNGATASTPSSISAVRDVVDNYLRANNVFDCNLDTAMAGTPVGWKWTFTATGCSGGNLTLTVNRGYAPTPTAGTVTVEYTKVTISYPYQWQVNRVISVLGGNMAVSPIPASAVMQNLN